MSYPLKQLFIFKTLHTLHKQVLYMHLNWRFTNTNTLLNSQKVLRNDIVFMTTCCIVYILFRTKCNQERRRTVFCSLSINSIHVNWSPIKLVLLKKQFASISNLRFVESRMPKSESVRCDILNTNDKWYKFNIFVKFISVFAN